jgi:2-polyprenyl-6-hydroxyphenyl methylase / 3-demethylubiquinone-9 3-methyltransferase
MRCARWRASVCWMWAAAEEFLLRAWRVKVRASQALTSAEAIAAREPASFDVITCMEMLEHVPDPAAVVQACTTLVKPGGHVFFSTINRNPKSFLFAIVGAEYVLKLLPRGTHEYVKFIKPHELLCASRNAGLQELEMKGLGYNPFTEHYSLNADTSVNYMIALRKPAQLSS